MSERQNKKQVSQNGELLTNFSTIFYSYIFFFFKLKYLLERLTYIYRGE